MKVPTSVYPNSTPERRCSFFEGREGHGNLPKRPYMKAIKDLLFFQNALLNFFHVFFCHLFKRRDKNAKKNVLLVMWFCVEWHGYFPFLKVSRFIKLFLWTLTFLDIYVTVFMGKRVRSLKGSLSHSK